MFHYDKCITVHHGCHVLIIELTIITTDMWNLASKLGQIDPIWDKIWDFLRLPSQNVLKLILKSPRFVPFGANLTQFGCQIWHPWFRHMFIVMNCFQGVILCQNYIIQQMEMENETFYWLFFYRLNCVYKHYTLDVA